VSRHPLGTGSLARSLLPMTHPVESKFELVRETLKVTKNETDPIQPTRIKRKEINQVTYHDACTYLQFAIEIHNNNT